MIYDCRPEPEPGTHRFPVPVRVVDAASGERIPNVFYLDTAPAKVGRFVTGADGEPLASRKRSKPVHDGRGGFKIETTYDRLEVWEYRPWRAVCLKTGAVVAEGVKSSEG